MIYYLYNTLFLQVAGICFTYFLQHRILLSTTVLAILADGPCHSISPNVCFSAYHIFLGIYLCSGLSTSNTVAFRYYILVHNEMSQKTIYLRIALTYIPSIISVIIPFTSQWNFEHVQNITEYEHPDYHYQQYRPYSGFSDIESVQFLSATILLTLGAYFIPFCSALLSIKIVKLINAHRGMSTRTKKLSRLLVRGLVCQTILPLICYIPLPTAYTISQLSRIDLTRMSTSLTLLLSIPSFIDPLISFYCIVPYRKAILRWFSCAKNQKNNDVTNYNATKISV